MGLVLQLRLTDDGGRRLGDGRRWLSSQFWRRNNDVVFVVVLVLIVVLVVLVTIVILIFMFVVVIVVIFLLVIAVLLLAVVVVFILVVIIVLLLLDYLLRGLGSRLYPSDCDAGLDGGGLVTDRANTRPIRKTNRTEENENKKE